MQAVDFYEVSRAVQDRFTSSVRGEGQPRPMLAIRAGVPREVLVWSAIGVGGTAVLVLLFIWGLGDLQSGVAIQPIPFVVAYALAASTVAFSVIHVLSRLRAKWSLPYRAGTYLFPSGVIEALDHRLRVFPLSRLVTPLVEERSLTLTFPEGPKFTFPLAVAGKQDEVRRAIEQAQEAVEKAHASGDKKSLGVLDPLVDIGVVNPFAPTGRIAKNTPFWARQVWVVGGVVGVTAALGIWFVRNFASDAQMLAAANKQRDAESFRAYLARGGRKGDVRDVLLPRAELSEAVKDGSVQAIEKYMSDHPGSRIQNEVSAALRQAMLNELEGVKKTSSVTALNDFSKRHPNNLVEPEVRQAVHAVYQGALARYKRESGIRDQTIFAFVERLLAFAEKSGPHVEVRFRRKQTKSMELADTQIKKSPFYMGITSLPSQYFDDAHVRPREAVAGKAITARFGAAFPADILSFEVGPPLLETDVPLPTSRVPTLFVEHAAEMSGASYLSANPRGVYVGLGMVFEATFKIPDEGKAYRYRVSTWRPPEASKVDKGDHESFESAVYDAMATEAFTQFAQKYLNTYFAKSEVRASAAE